MAPNGAADVAASLSSMTVPQLKVVCKEKKITGYSKLGKAALIQKLTEAGYSPANALPVATEAATPPEPSITTSGVRPPPSTQPTASARPAKKSKLQPKVSALPTTALQADSSKSTPSLAVSSSSSARIHVDASSVPSHTTSTLALGSASVSPLYLSSPSSSAATGRTTNEMSTAQPLSAAPIESSNRRAGLASGLLGAAFRTSLVNPTKRPLDAEAPAPKKKQKLVQDKSKLVKAANVNARVPAPPPKPLATTIPLPSAVASANVSSASATLLSTFAPATRKDIVPVVVSTRSLVGSTVIEKDGENQVVSGKPCGKRFKPLVIAPRVVQGHSAKESTPTTHTPTVPFKPTPNRSAAIFYLDLSPPPPHSALVPITFPPSLSQRKRVQRWAVILSGLGDAERRQCTLVSRMFRYAVYLSASHILQDQYCGARLDQDVLQRYSKAMTNMWPYLRARELEARQRRKTYAASFLHGFFRGHGLAEPIATRLWASPDSERQIVIALRFVMSRLWFALSLGGPDSGKGSEAWLCGTVIDAQEVVKGEIWSITVAHACPTREEVFYVLEATCEVVGHRTPATGDAAVDDTTQVSSLTLRADWLAYIQQRRVLSPDGAPNRPLLAHLKWANCEEYEHGVSRLWLKRILAEGTLGKAKQVVAERYVLACVVGNSVSGQWKTAAAMAQDFAGLPSRANPGIARPKIPVVHMYLPEHHHVESVHFAAANGRALHGALAVVQTTHREYYILRDNGMQVGCEEDGVAEIWRDVLGCDRLGC